MAELPRYRGVSAQVQSGAKTYMAQARTIDSFIQGIKGIERGATDMLATESVAQAKQDAEQAFTTEGKSAKMNDSMSVYGQQYRQSLQNLQQKQVSIDTTKKFKDLYAENKDNPALFETVTNAYRDEALKGMPDHQKANFVIDYEANKASYGAQIKENRINADKEKAYATGLEFHTQKIENATQAFRDGSYNRGIAEANMAKANIQDLLDGDLITEPKAVELRNAIDKKITWANFKGVNDRYIEDSDLEGAQKAIEKFRKSSVPGLDDAGREQLADSMQADLNTAINRQNAILKNSSKFDNKRADELIYLYNELENVEDAELRDALNGNISPDKREKLSQAYKDSGAMKVFSSMSIDKQEAEVIEERKNENKTADGLRLLKRKEKALEKLKKLKSTNPIEYTEKYLGQKLETLDITDENFAEKALSRTSFIENVEITSGVKTGLLKPSEIADTKRKIDAMGVEDKLLFLSSINMVDEKIANRTYEDLGGGIGFAGYLSLIGNETATGTTLLGSTSKIPLEPKFKAEIAQKLINAFPHKADMYIAGAEDYARGYELEHGKKPTIDDVIKNTLGTAVKKNGRSFFLPYGSNETQLDNWLEGIEIEGRPELTENLRSLKNSIFTGNTQLQQVGNGRYAVISTIDGASFVEMDSTDDTKPLILEFGK